MLVHKERRWREDTEHLDANPENNLLHTIFYPGAHTFSSHRILQTYSGILGYSRPTQVYQDTPGLLRYTRILQTYSGIPGYSRPTQVYYDTPDLTQVY